jgi:membrane associated rhomboid family serine protease
MSAAAPPAPPSRLAQFFRTCPLVTSCILCVCIAVYVVDNLLDFGEALSITAVSPSTVFGQLQFYRVVTAAFTHGGLLHVGMNMLSLVSLGSSLEPLFGSLGFFFLTLLYTVLVGLLYCCLGALASLASASFWYGSAVGFSGVLFAYAVDETSLSPTPTRSVFGLFTVPTRYYPWVLMLLLQVLLPNVSLLGHLAGILVGLCHSAGLLKLLLPSAAALRRVESGWLPPALTRLPPYRLAPPTEASYLGSGGCAALCAPLRGAAGALLACARGAADGGGGARAPPAPPPPARFASAAPDEELAGGEGDVAPLLAGGGAAAPDEALAPVAAAEARARNLAAIEARQAAREAVGRPALRADAAAAAEKAAAAAAAEREARAAAAAAAAAAASAGGSGGSPRGTPPTAAP